MAIHRDNTALKAAPLITGHDEIPPEDHYQHMRGLTDWLIIMTLGGKGILTHKRGSIELQRGDVILYSPSTPLDYVATGTQPWARVWMVFAPRAHWLAWLKWPAIGPGVMKIKCLQNADIRAIKNALVLVHEHHHRSEKRHDDMAMNHMEHALLLCNAQCPQSLDERCDERISRLIALTEHAPAKKWTLDLLAENCDLSVSQLCKLFRMQTGASPMVFIEQKRLRHAMEMLQLTSRNIEAISRELGFDNPFYFSSRFKIATGLSPRAYRKRQRNVAK